MSDCIFCDIVAGRVPSRKVYEDAATLAFLDIQPVSPGHCVVIPKRHTVWVTDLAPEDAGPFFRAVFLVARKIRKALSAEYVSVIMRGTRVPHVHALLVPKLPGQDNILDKTLDLHHFLQACQAPVADTSELDAIAERIGKGGPA